MHNYSFTNSSTKDIFNKLFQFLNVGSTEASRLSHTVKFFKRKAPEKYVSLLLLLDTLATFAFRYRCNAALWVTSKYKYLLLLLLLLLLTLPTDTSGEIWWKHNYRDDKSIMIAPPSWENKKCEKEVGNFRNSDRRHGKYTSTITSSRQDMFTTVYHMSIPIRKSITSSREIINDHIFFERKKAKYLNCWHILMVGTSRCIKAAPT